MPSDLDIDRVAARIGGDWETASDCYSSAIVWSAWVVGSTADAQTVASGYMPLGNLTGITEEEREKIAIWFAQGARTAD